MPNFGTYVIGICCNPECVWKGKEHEIIIQLQEVCATICFNALLFYAYLPQAYTLQVSRLMTYAMMFHLLYLLLSKFIIFCNIAYIFIPNGKLKFIGNAIWLFISSVFAVAATLLGVKNEASSSFHGIENR